MFFFCWVGGLRKAGKNVNHWGPGGLGDLGSKWDWISEKGWELEIANVGDSHFYIGGQNLATTWDVWSFVENAKKKGHMNWICQMWINDVESSIGLFCRLVGNGGIE